MIVADAVEVKIWSPQQDRIKNPAYSKKCNVTRDDTTSSMCVFGDPNTGRTVVYGDSHAAMWIPAFDVVGKQAHWRIVQLTKPACQVPDFPSYSEALKREYTECEEYRKWALTKIAEIKPDVIVMSSAFRRVSRAVDGKQVEEGVDDVWATGLAAVLDRIAPYTGRMDGLGDMAYPAELGIDCLTVHPDDVSACNTPRDEAVFAGHNALEQRVAVEHAAEYVDTIPWLCTAPVCPAVIGRLTTHRDAYHLAENDAVWLALALGTATGLLPEGAHLMPS